MRLLLDTHTFLWSLFDDKKLADTVHTLIADRENEICVSVIKFWEISLKYALGKLELKGVLPDELPEYAQQTGFEILPLAVEDVATFYKLPTTKHKTLLID